MNKTLTLFAFLFLFVCIGFTFAQTDQPRPEDQQRPEEQQQIIPQEQLKVPTSQNQQLTGVIQKIDLEKKTITLKDERSRKTQDLDFNEKTTFNKAGQSITVDQLQKGDKVSLEVDSQNLVTRIEITLPDDSTPPENKQ